MKIRKDKHIKTDCSNRQITASHALNHPSHPPMSPPQKATYRERMQNKAAKAAAQQIAAIEAKLIYLKQNTGKKGIMNDVGICRNMVFELPADLGDVKEDIKHRFFKIQRMVQSRVIWESQTLSRLVAILDD